MDIDENGSTNTSPKSGSDDTFDDTIEPEEDKSNQPVLRNKRKETSSCDKDQDADKDQDTLTMVIPERKAPIGKAKELSINESKFFRYAFENNQPIKVQSNNPKLKKSKSRARYERYKDATTLREF
mmetsp:Transcript_10382/g.13562  ORF Transcript_10382/g.13562 Transcript_10382/m.13562 type:complete len:126 (+) Transcript_10382:2609-2986(+)